MSLVKRLELEPEVPQRMRRGPRKYVTKGPSQPGTDNGGSVLTEDDVILIRRLREQGWKVMELADMFGVVQATIWALLKRRTWRHV